MNMREALDRLEITNVIVHDVPRKTAGPSQPLTLSETESELTADLAVDFATRIRISLDKAAFDAVVDVDRDHVVPPLILSQLTDQPDNFVIMSQAVAGHLHICQTAKNSPGLLVVIRGTLAGDRCLALMKLERQLGVQLAQIENNGKLTYNIRQVRDLMLTDQTKVFKAAIFIQGGDGMVGLTALVSDHQRGYSHEIANFFLHQFLGCRLAELPEVTTKRFFDSALSFIHDHVTEPELKTRYHIALMSEMNGSREAVRPIEFADTHMVGAHRSQLLTHFSDHGIPTSDLPKDRKLIDRQLKSMTWRFEGGLALVGPPEEFDARVTTVDDETGMSQTIIRDGIKNVGK